MRYFELFRARADSWNTQNVETAGGGGSSKHDVYIQPRLVMKSGTSTVILKDVSIVPVHMNSGLDVLFGNLGQDFLEGFETFSLNFATMTFRLGVPRGIL